LAIWDTRRRWNFYLIWKLKKKKSYANRNYLLLKTCSKQNYIRKLDISVIVSNYSFRLEIAAFLKTDVASRERNRNYMIERIYEVRSPKLDSKLVLFYYLSKFPLFGYKYFDQFYLNKIHNLFLNKEHKTQEGKAKLIQYTNLKIVEVINKPYWDHHKN
jgi:hypothetical protein